MCGQQGGKFEVMQNPSSLPQEGTSEEFPSLMTNFLNDSGICPSFPPSPG